MLIIFCLALAWAIQGAAAQTWTDGRAAVRSGGQAVRQRTAAARKSPRHGVRAAAILGTGAGVLAVGAWRTGRGMDRSLWTGARNGWRKGRDRGHARREAKRAHRDEQRDDPTPTWGHYITGRCPQCCHLPRASAAETDGCECSDTDWGCRCALGRRSAGRRTPPEHDNIHLEPTTTQSGPELVDLDELQATPDGGTMSQAVTTGEAASIEQTRLGLLSFGEIAAEHLEHAALAHDQAKGLAAAAEQMLGDLTTADLDAQTLADITALQEQAAELEAAAQRLSIAAEGTHAAAGGALSGMDSRHRGVEEAVNATQHAAATDWYRG